jgi:hypothetical protein
MIIKRTVKNLAGKIVELEIEINNAQVGGTATCDGQKWEIRGYAMVRGRKVLSIKGGPAPYLVIDDRLYAEIDRVAREQYRAQMSAEEKEWEHVCSLELAYKRLIDNSDSNADIIKAKSAYEQALAEFVARYPNSHHLISNRVHYNDRIDISTDKVWIN